MYEAGGDPQVFRTACLDMIEGMGPKNLKADLFIRTCALHNNIEAMFRQGIVCVVSVIICNLYHLSIFSVIDVIY